MQAKARIAYCGMQFLPAFFYPLTTGADSWLAYPRAEALGSANRQLAGLKPSASTEVKRYSDSGAGLATGSKAVPQRILDGVLNDLRVLLAEELLQASGVHGVRADHVRQGGWRNGRNSPLPQKLQNRTTSGARNALDLGVCYLRAALHGYGLSAARDIQDGQRRIGLGPVQEIHEQPRDVVHMHELELLLEVLLAGRQHQRKPFAGSAHAFGALALAQRCPAQRSHHVVLHAGAGEDVRAQDVNAAIAQTLGAIADRLVALALVDGVWQGMRAERSFLFHWPRCFRAISRHAAGKDELPDVAAGAIHDAHRLHYAGRPGHIDLPHAFHVNNTAAQGIEDEGEMDHGGCAGRAQQLNQLPAGRFAAQVHLLVSRQRNRTVGWAHIHAHHAKVGEQRKQPDAQVSRYTRDQYRAFRRHDY